MSVAHRGGAEAIRVPHPLVVRGLVDEAEAFCGLTESTLRQLAAQGYGSVDLLVRFRSHYDRRMIISIDELLALADANSRAPEAVIHVADIVTTAADAYSAVRDVFLAAAIA